MNPSFLVASALYMGLIFVLSAQPGSAVGLPPPWDKLAHTLEYALLGFLLSRAFSNPGAAFVIASLYGVSDEFHQSFVPGREASIGDWLADSLGAFAGARFLLKRLRSNFRG